MLPATTATKPSQPATNKPRTPLPGNHLELPSSSLQHRARSSRWVPLVLSSSVAPCGTWVLESLRTWQPRGPYRPGHPSQLRLSLHLRLCFPTPERCPGAFLWPNICPVTAWGKVGQLLLPNSPSGHALWQSRLRTHNPT